MPSKSYLCASAFSHGLLRTTLSAQASQCVRCKAAGLLSGTSSLSTGPEDKSRRLQAQQHFARQQGKHQKVSDGGYEQMLPCNRTRASLCRPSRRQCIAPEHAVEVYNPHDQGLQKLSGQCPLECWDTIHLSRLQQTAARTIVQKQGVIAPLHQLQSPPVFAVPGPLERVTVLPCTADPSMTESIAMALLQTSCAQGAPLLQSGKRFCP